MLGTLDPQVKEHWPEEVTFLMHAYNCTKNNATSYSSYFLMFGCKPLIPTDVEFGVHTPNFPEMFSTKYETKYKNV